MGKRKIGILNLNQTRTIPYHSWIEKTIILAKIISTYYVDLNGNGCSYWLVLALKEPVKIQLCLSYNSWYRLFYFDVDILCNDLEFINLIFKASITILLEHETPTSLCIFLNSLMWEQYYILFQIGLNIFYQSSESFELCHVDVFVLFYHKFFIWHWTKAYLINHYYTVIFRNTKIICFLLDIFSYINNLFNYKNVSQFSLMSVCPVIPKKNIM